MEDYKRLFDDGFKSAFDMVDIAIEAIGAPPKDGTAQWTFPDQETRDLAARTFGDAKASKLPKVPTRYATVKTNFEYIRDKFTPKSQPEEKGILIQDGVGTLTEADIIVYCTLTRLSRAGDFWTNVARPEEGPYDKGQYEDCISGKTLAIAGSLEGVRQVIQLCQMDKMATKKYKILPDRANIWMEHRGTFTDFCKRLFRINKVEVDYYDMFDHTLLHEMTHCIKSARNEDDEYTRIRTGDWGTGGGYHWSGVRARSNIDGWMNADSYAFFSLGAWMLKNKQTKISNNGCLTVDPKYNFGRQPAGVNGDWTAPNQKRTLHESIDLSNNINAHTRNLVNPLEMRQFTTSAFLTPTSNGAPNTTSNSSSKTSSSRIRESNGSTASSEISQSWSFTSFDSLRSSSLYSTGSLATSSLVLDSTPINSSSQASTDTFTVTSLQFKWTTSSDGLKASTLPTTSLDSAPPDSNSSAIMSWNITSSEVAITESSFTEVLASKTLSEEPTGGSLNRSSISPPNVSTPSSTPPVQSAQTTNANAPGLPPSFISETPTTAPDGPFLICPALTSCIKPTPTWLESIISAPTGLFIPKITDLGAVPTQKVKENEDDDDNTAVIFAKIVLPKDKCDPLPKPKAGGLAGVVTNIANKIRDTVIDAACNMEFPVIDKNLPDWLDFTKFPGLRGYPPPSESPPDSENPTVSAKESSAASSRNSCKATELPRCEATAIISGTVTAKATSCTIVSACSQTGATDITSITHSCSATAVPQCKGTNIMSGTITKDFTTECSTITACSGTGTTSITNMTDLPSVTHFVHPEDPEGWDDQQDCFMSLMENTDGDIGDEALGSCFGTSIIPETSASSTSDIPKTSSKISSENPSSNSESVIPSETSYSPSATPTEPVNTYIDQGPINKLRVQLPSLYR